MAPTTFTLASLSDSHIGGSFLSSLSELPTDQRPFWVGKTQHWMDPPELSCKALYQDGTDIVQWDYLVVSESPLPTSVENATDRVWSITTDVTDDQISALATAKADNADKVSPPLPAGWSSSDHSGLDAAIGPKDLELSLSLEAYTLGSNTNTTQAVILKDFIRDFGKAHPDEPVAMLNLLAYLPGQREKYLPYAETFQKSTGSKRGGQPLLQSLTGAGGTDWSTRQEDEAVGSWRDVLLVGYPSIWHFGKMLDDEGYQEADRKYKVGVVQDNPILFTTKVEI
ncbi:hypothetical protein CKM354_000099200 [Cercospora kikuchii]|uniref:Uncharacterized protein n=1 Tax=Cercospora kikuchii TaxID=84275 RepID=A0A9P3F8A9_9PEZI|nr:uncharacterized protein CKM354_000099200 [Cercospora kikuchii]GIZ37548.1 hypothetical protein CKM354_000099200 [Cercospora kikuchii]